MLPRRPLTLTTGTKWMVDRPEPVISFFDASAALSNSSVLGSHSLDPSHCCPCQDLHQLQPPALSPLPHSCGGGSQQGEGSLPEEEGHWPGTVSQVSEEVGPRRGKLRLEKEATSLRPPEELGQNHFSEVLVWYVP